MARQQPARDHRVLSTSARALHTHTHEKTTTLYLHITRALLCYLLCIFWHPFVLQMGAAGAEGRGGGVDRGGNVPGVLYVYLYGCNVCVCVCVWGVRVVACKYPRYDDDDGGWMFACCMCVVSCVACDSALYSTQLDSTRLESLAPTLSHSLSLCVGCR